MSRRVSPSVLLASWLCMSGAARAAAPAGTEAEQANTAAERVTTEPDPASTELEPAGAVRKRAPLGPPTERAHYGRAALEATGSLLIGLAQYWITAASNSRDWDSPRLVERFNRENIRFDNNTHVTNNLLHPLAGASYYGLSRANGLSVGESVLYAQVASAIWEWGLEWREKVSINDMITTTAGGTAVGEVLVQLAAYLNSAPDGGGPWQSVAASTLGFPVWMHDRLDGRKPDASARRDNLGFSADYRHRFTLDLKNTWADDAAEQSEQLRGFRLTTQLSSLRGFLDPRSFDAFFARGNFTEAYLDLELDGSGLRNTAVGFDALLAGYYVQWANPEVTGLLVGLGTGLEFVDRTSIGRGDQYALAHFVGPSLAVFQRRGELTWTLATRLYGDFATLTSLAYPKVQARPFGPMYKSTLERGYQYHLGASLRCYGELRFHALLLSAEWQHGRYSSIEGLDRFQEQITADLEGHERLDDRRATLAIEPPGAPVRAFAGVERFWRESELGGERAGRLERRFVAGMGLAF